MRLTRSWIVLCSIATLGCAQPRPAPTEARARTESITWPEDWSTLLGQRVTIDGWAGELKLGSMLFEDPNFGKGSIWIDGNRWPDGFYEGPDKRKHVRVTGTVIKRDDMPVVGPGGLPEGAAGVGPSRSFEETQRMKWRFLLKDVKWQVID